MAEFKYIINISKYFSSFDCFDKSLIVLSATSSGISSASFATPIGALVGTESLNLVSC